MQVAALVPNGRGGLYPGRIAIEAGRVSAIRSSTRSASSPAADLDLRHHIALPGFIDLQINGAFGHDITSAPESMWPIGAQLPRHGVTAFLPTVITSPARQRQGAYRAMAARPAGYAGAVPLGLHVEGPALLPNRAGVHPVGALVDDTADVTEELVASAGTVSLVTLAPELPNAAPSIERLAAAGITVSLGHTGATAAQTADALRSGATAFTHLFNGMAPMHHRELGAVGTALLHPTARITVIADGHHLADDTIRLVWRLAGPERICLITDAMAGLDAPEGTHRLGDVAVQCGAVPLNDDGRIAGSLVSMDAAARRFRDATGATWDELAAVTSGNQADLLGDADRGRLEPGARADLTIVDSDLSPVVTMVEGAVLYRRRARSTVVGAAAGRDRTDGAGSCEPAGRSTSAQFNAAAAIGIDIGGTTFKAALLTGMELGPLHYGATGLNRAPSEVIAAVRSVIKDLAGSSDADIGGIGVACAGIVDPKTGTVVRSASLDWREVDIIGGIGDDLGIPMAFDHDVYAAALAEWEAGAGLDAGSMLYVSVGTGIACRLFTQAGTDRGSAGLAGEMGFLPLEGQKWLEAAASARGIADAYERQTGRSLTAEQIAASTKHDPAAASVWSAAMDALARAIASAICLQDPQIVVIGGGVSKANHKLLDALEPRLSSLLKPLRTPPTTVVAAHGADSGVVGAALLGLKARANSPTADGSRHYESMGTASASSPSWRN